jgi:hypothetical protein
VDLIRALNPEMSFPEAVAYLTGRPAPTLPGKGTCKPTARPASPPPSEPSGLTEADALALVEAAAARLWTPDGASALAYLHGRGLADATIRAARLGWTPRADGIGWNPPGIVIPWFASGRLVFLKVRPPDAWRGQFPAETRPPKYLAPRSWPQPATLYPSIEAIRPGRPLVIAEGEFDCLLLAQEMFNLNVGVMTPGGASMGRHGAGMDPAILAVMLSAPTWLIATDADAAGDRSAAAWDAYPRARRVRPPAPFKDWTEAGTDAPGTIGTAVHLARWWSDILAGESGPLLFTVPELAGWRWGPAVDGSAFEDDDTAERLAIREADW